MSNPPLMNFSVKPNISKGGSGSTGSVGSVAAVAHRLKLSFRLTLRLNTGLSSVLSLSRQK